MRAHRDRRYIPRFQRTTILLGILCVVVLIVVVQLWLLTATMNAYLGGERDLLLAALIVSALCFALNLGLLRDVYKLDR